jgi:ubiquinone/menaquinone biosynthesis C-methylase UbiE
MTHWTEETYVDAPEVVGTNMRQGIDAAGAEVADLLTVLDEHGVHPERALDVACGIGRHAVPLAGDGVEVHGVDISPEYVQRARERAAEAGVADRTTFEVGDMRELGGVGDEYDLVTVWLAFGYFDDETNEAIAGALRERVADGGALVMGVHNKDGVVADYEASSATLQDGVLAVYRNEYTPETGRLETRITMLRQRDEGYESVGDAVVDVRLYAPAELRRVLERAGFSTVHLYAGPDGAALERDSERCVVVAEP